MKVRCDSCRRVAEYSDSPTFETDTLYLCPSCHYVRGLHEKKAAPAPIDTPETYANAKRRRDEDRLAHIMLNVFGTYTIPSGEHLDALSHYHGLSRSREETDAELRVRLATVVNRTYFRPDEHVVGVDGEVRRATKARMCGYTQCFKIAPGEASYCDEHATVVYGRKNIKGHEAYGVAVDEAVAYSAPVVQPPPVWMMQCKACRVSFASPSRTQWCVTCSAERTRRESAPGIEAKFKYVTKPETRRAVEVVIDNSFWED